VVPLLDPGCHRHCRQSRGRREHDGRRRLGWSGDHRSTPVGTYTTTFDFGTQAGLAARLDLGAVTDTFRIWVNGKRLPAQDIIDTVVDLDGYLVAGRNVLKVEVASTMRNAVRVARGGQWTGFAKQDYGLLGPVTLRPYLKVAL
jgi:hypothetical protein